MSFKQGILLGAGATVLATPFVARWAYRAFVPVVPKAVEESSSSMVHLLDTMTEDPVDFMGEVEEREFIGEVRPLKRGRLLECAVAVALLVRSELGVMRRTEANKMVVAHYVTKLLRLRNLRAGDVARVLPVAVIACFVESAADVEAKQLASSYSVVQRVASAERTYKSGMVGAWLERWWGDLPTAITFAK